MRQLGLGHIGWLSRDEGPECRTVAWCDINAKKMADSAAKHPDIRMYTDYREMLNHPGLDAVVISAPNWVHAEQAIAFLEAGKSVFVEKPMGVNKAECDRILQAVKKTGLNFTVDFEMRTSPFAARIRELIDAGKYGKLRRIEFIHHRGCWLEEGNGIWRTRPEKSGGHFLMEPIHEVDICRYFAGEIKAVQTIAGPNVLDQYRFPDNLCSHLFFQSGVVATLLASHTHSGAIPWDEQNDPGKMRRQGHDMNMIFTFAGASIGVDFVHARIMTNIIEEYPKGSGGKRVVHQATEIIRDGDIHAFAHDIAAMRWTFIRRCGAGQPMVQDPVDIWKTHVVCLAAERSMIEDGRRIEIDYSLPAGVQ